MTVTYTEMVCAKCGSNDVHRDATAVWDKYTGQWELGGVMDQAICGFCGETDLKEKNVKERMVR